MKEYTTYSPVETQALGVEIGSHLKRGDIVCVSGGLGSGKTCLIQGIARGLGVGPDAYVRSPTYTILLTYEGRVPLHHFDFYRLSRMEEIEELGLDEYLDSDDICAIEWPERLGPIMPGQRMDIVIEEISERQRKITVVDNRK